MRAEASVATVRRGTDNGPAGTWRGTAPHALALVLWNVGTGVPWPSGLGCAPTALGCTVPAGRPG
jgi:hypothetical protein